MSETFENSIQSLYPGEVITLVEIDGTKFGAQIYRMHNENITFTPAEILAATNGATLQPKTIMFQGNEYGARPFGITGISFNGNGKAGKPQLSLSNIDGQVAALIRSYNGMMQAKVTIYVTMKDLMDSSGNVKAGDMRKFVYYIERPNFVNPTVARFDLSSVYDMDGIMVPPRITQSVCYWASRSWYRSGKGCDYNGSKYFDKDNKPVSDPSLDVCAGTVTACKLRNGDRVDGLPFGGCAVASLARKNQ